jgi:ABC-2 type transport system permease protein
MYFFRIVFKNSLVYRWPIVFSVLGSVFFIAVNLMLWRFLFRNDAVMITYMTRYTILSNIVAMFYTRGIANRIGDKVTSGAFVIDLVRPINFFTMSWQIELANMCSTLLMRGLPVVLIYLPFLIDGSIWHNVPAAILAVGLGHTLFLLIYSLLGFAAFILIEIWPFGRLLDDTIRLFAGGFIPIAFLPNGLKGLANLFPFRFLYSFPLELLLGSAEMSSIINKFSLFFVWVITFAVLNSIMYRLALSKTVVQGG